ncbi:hypothetical protein GQ54DRAFT_298615 [Martensiomyces pterosporus]|nr:hypothetical protein GQ54DRAFT_298615 [Martensiomyces pterosporus]
MSAYSSLRGGHSPAVDGHGSWIPSSRRNRMSSNIDLDHVRNLMEAIEIVSPNMVGADLVGTGSPIPESRSGWSLPGHVPRGQSEQHGPAASLGAAPVSGGGCAHTHAVRHRRTSVQVPHAPGIPIRPTRSRNRSMQIDPVEFAEYAVAHMRPSPRFTPMGHGFPLSSSAASEPRSSLPRSFLGSMRESHLHHALHANHAQAQTQGHASHPVPEPGRAATLQLPRQNGLDEIRYGYSPHSSTGHASRETSPGSGRSSRSPAMPSSSSLMNGGSALV